MWRNMETYQTVTNSPWPHINAELLLVSTQYSFSCNSQIKCFWTHVDMDFFPCSGMWNSCPKCVCNISYTLYIYILWSSWLLLQSHRWLPSFWRNLLPQPSLISWRWSSKPRPRTPLTTCEMAKYRNQGDHKLLWYLQMSYLWLYSFHTCCVAIQIYLLVFRQHNNSVNDKNVNKFLTHNNTSFICVVATFHIVTCFDPEWIIFRWFINVKTAGY
jgi:hypothetical protein